MARLLLVWSIYWPWWPDEFVKRSPEYSLTHIFVKINTWLLPWKKLPINLGYLCMYYSKTFQSKRSPKRRKFATSGHPVTGVPRL
jgi:hypothetical protein